MAEITREEAEAIVDAIFEDLRDRRFLKWLFDDDPKNAGPILYKNNGEPLLPLDLEVQNEIREAWIAILLAARKQGGSDDAR